MSVPLEKFGQDHWSTFAYLECRCVDDGGVPDDRQMRCDHDLHPQLTHLPNSSSDRYPTRLKGEEALRGHDDWSCVEDFIAAGLILNKGTEIHHIWEMTEKGWNVIGQLRKHKASGGNYRNFEPKI